MARALLHTWAAADKISKRPHRKEKKMDNHESLFEIETLQDWQLNANLDIEPVEDTGGGASNSNSCCNNSADQP
jgi:hypothetical protein